jgi:hypothetical protein
VRLRAPSTSRTPFLVFKIESRPSFANGAAQERLG